ncbi:hypothetical protein T492DRAFT_73291 [Pavlovales sp. CCMP2436]|nr:hypothetical protein T492DRAFT_73291 [Pavlovales sp. CCMP2436]
MRAITPLHRRAEATASARRRRPFHRYDRRGIEAADGRCRGGGWSQRLRPRPAHVRPARRDNGCDRSRPRHAGRCRGLAAGRVPAAFARAWGEATALDRSALSPPSALLSDAAVSSNDGTEEHASHAGAASRAHAHLRREIRHGLHLMMQESNPNSYYAQASAKASAKASAAAERAPSCAEGGGGASIKEQPYIVLAMASSRARPPCCSRYFATTRRAARLPLASRVVSETMPLAFGSAGASAHRHRCECDTLAAVAGTSRSAGSRGRVLRPVSLPRRPEVCKYHYHLSSRQRQEVASQRSDQAQVDARSASSVQNPEFRSDSSEFSDQDKFSCQWEAASNQSAY